MFIMARPGPTILYHIWASYFLKTQLSKVCNFNDICLVSEISMYINELPSMVFDFIKHLCDVVWYIYLLASEAFKHQSAIVFCATVHYG